MLFGVPQYIDIEDKVAGPLTGKQLLWMFGMGAVLLILWNVLEKGAFFVAAIPVAALFGALAFYKPYGQPFVKFIMYATFFVFRPKTYVWKREIPTKKLEENKNTGISAPTHAKIKDKAPLEEIEELAKVLDSEGRERNEKIMKIINKNRKLT